MKILAAAVILTLVACAPTTPEARIEATPWKFERLSPAHQELVRKGRIDRGMSPDAVYLAWGRPAAEYEGFEDGVKTLRWDYAGSKPVVSSEFSTFYGSGYGYRGYGPYRRGYYPGYGYGVGNQINYIPYRKGTVWFENQRVAKWEQRRD